MATLLEQAVSTLPKLDMIATNDKLLSKSEGKERLDFESYYELLIEAAQKAVVREPSLVNKLLRSVYVSQKTLIAYEKLNEAM